MEDVVNASVMGTLISVTKRQATAQPLVKITQQGLTVSGVKKDFMATQRMTSSKKSVKVREPYFNIVDDSYEYDIIDHENN